MSTLIAITYDDEQKGRAAFAELGNLQKMKVLTLEDAALATKDKKGKVKVQLGLARGKRAYDKRHDMAKRDADREISRAMKNKGRFS